MIDSVITGRARLRGEIVEYFEYESGRVKVKKANGDQESLSAEEFLKKYEPLISIPAGSESGFLEIEPEDLLAGASTDEDNQGVVDAEEKTADPEPKSIEGVTLNLNLGCSDTGEEPETAQDPEQVSAGDELGESLTNLEN